MQFPIDVINRCFLNDKGETISPEEAKNLKDYQRRYLPAEVLKILEDDTLPNEMKCGLMPFLNGCIISPQIF